MPKSVRQNKKRNKSSRVHSANGVAFDFDLGEDTPKRNKYNAIKTEADGIKFDSLSEAIRYSELKLLQMAGEISDLECHPSYLLQEKFKWRGFAVRSISYEPDFRYRDMGSVGCPLIVEDVKSNTSRRGTQTSTFELKAKWFKKTYPDIDLYIVKVDSKSGQSIERFLHGSQSRTRSTKRTSGKQRKVSGAG